VRTHGDLIEDHISGLLDSKQPETMALIIAARMEGAKQGMEEIQKCLGELTPGARTRIIETSRDLLSVHSYVAGAFNSQQQGWESILRHVKMKQSLAGDPESLSRAEEEDW